MSRARDLASSGVTSTVLSNKAPLASPDFTGTVDLTGTTVNLDNDQISGDKVSGGTIGAGTFSGTIGSSATFPAGMVVNVASNSASDSINTPSNTGYAHAVELLAVSWQLKTTNPLLVAYFHCQTGTQDGTASWNMDFNYDTNTTNSGFSYSQSNLFSGDATSGSLYPYYSDSDTDRRRPKILKASKVITGTAGHYCEVQCEAWNRHNRANEYYGFKTITVFEVAQ